MAEYLFESELRMRRRKLRVAEEERHRNELFNDSYNSVDSRHTLDQTGIESDGSQNLFNSELELERKSSRRQESYDIDKEIEKIEEILKSLKEYDHTNTDVK